MQDSRGELLEKLGEIELWPEVKSELNGRLKLAVLSKDLEFVKALVRAGANPNPEHNLDCFMHHLLHEYRVGRSTNGELILELITILLEAGANPNRIWGNNLRAYDYATRKYDSPVRLLLEKYGADKNPREAI